MTSSKGVIFATIFVGLLSAIVTLYIHFDGDQNQSALKVEEAKNEQYEKEEEKNERTPSLDFSKVFVTPIDTKLPSSFYLEVNNSGRATAMNFILTINFGESQAHECEYVPYNVSADNISSGTIIRTTIKELPEKQSLYVICTTNSPIFKSISVGGGNIEVEKKLTYEKYKEQLHLSFYESLWRNTLVIALALSVFLFFWRIVLNMPR